MVEKDDWQEVALDESADDWQEVTDSSSPKVQASPKQDISKTESALRGAAQGLSMGWADEATAAAEAALSDKSYQQALEESRQAYKQAEQANPYTYVAGEVGGGIALPGFGMASAAKAPTMMAKLAKMGLIGATTGAVQGAGTSEAQDISGVLRDAEGSAKVGAVAAPVLGVAAPALLKAGGGAIRNMSSTADEAGKMFEYGQKGVDLVGEQAAIREEELLRDVIDKNVRPAVQGVNKLESGLYESAKDAARDKAFSVEDLLNFSLKTQQEANLPETATAATQRMIKSKGNAASRGFESVVQEPLEEAQDRIKQQMLNKYSSDVEAKRQALIKQIEEAKNLPPEPNISLLENQDVVQSMAKNDLTKQYSKKLMTLEADLMRKIESAGKDASDEQISALENLLVKVRQDEPIFDVVTDPKTGKEVMTVTSNVLKAMGTNLDPKPLKAPATKARPNIADLEAELAKLDSDMPQFMAKADDKTGANLMTLGSDVFGTAVKPVVQSKQLVKQTKEILQKPNLNIDELSILKNELSDALNKASTFEEQMYIQKVLNEVNDIYTKSLDPKTYGLAKQATKDLDVAESLLTGSTKGMTGRLAGEQALETKKLATKLTRAQAGDATQDVVDIERAKRAMMDVEKSAGKSANVSGAFDSTKEAAERAYLSKITTGSAEIMGDPTNPMSSLFISGKGKLMSAANLTGRAAQWTPDQFNNFATAIETKAIPGAKSVANKIRAIGNVGDMQKRKALLFSLEQSPEYRKMMEEEENGGQ